MAPTSLQLLGLLVCLAIPSSVLSMPSFPRQFANTKALDKAFSNYILRGLAELGPANVNEAVLDKAFANSDFLPGLAELGPANVNEAVLAELLANHFAPDLVERGSASVNRGRGFKRHGPGFFAPGLADGGPGKK